VNLLIEAGKRRSRKSCRPCGASRSAISRFANELTIQYPAGDGSLLPLANGEGEYEEQPCLSTGICFIWVWVSKRGITESGLISKGIQSKKRIEEQGAPILAEKIPFEPDLGNASVGNGE
jgi:hypothetical protein